MAPEGGAFADCHQLRGLEVGVTQAGQFLPGLGESCERVDRSDRLVADDLQGCSDQDQVSVIRYETARRSQVNDRAGNWSGIAQGVDAAPSRRAGTAARRRRPRRSRSSRPGAKGSNLLLGDRQPQGALGLRQGDP